LDISDLIEAERVRIRTEEKAKLSL